MRLLVIVGTLGLLSWAPLPEDAGGTPKPRTHTVVIEATAFTPQRLTVAAGDTVVWVNKDPFPHTATGEGKAFDSGTIEAGKSWKHAVRSKGRIEYVCAFHPTMTGILTVE